LQRRCPPIRLGCLRFSRTAQAGRSNRLMCPPCRQWCGHHICMVMCLDTCIDRCVVMWICGYIGVWIGLWIGGANRAATGPKGAAGQGCTRFSAGTGHPPMFRLECRDSKSHDTCTHVLLHTCPHKQANNQPLDEPTNLPVAAQSSMAVRALVVLRPALACILAFNALVLLI